MASWNVTLEMRFLAFQAQGKSSEPPHISGVSPWPSIVCSTEIAAPQNDSDITRGLRR